MISSMELLMSSDNISLRNFVWHVFVDSGFFSCPSDEQIQSPCREGLMKYLPPIQPMIDTVYLGKRPRSLSVALESKE